MLANTYPENTRRKTPQKTTSQQTEEITKFAAHARQKTDNKNRDPGGF